jgi:ComF family protein
MLFRLFRAFINLIFPKRCPVCARPLKPSSDKFLCIECSQEIKINLPPFCKKCGRPLRFSNSKCSQKHKNMNQLDRVWVACHYEGALRKLIHRIKYYGRIDLLEFAGFICVNFAVKYMDLKNLDYITYVPQSRSKKKQREFNQSEVISAYLAQKLKISFLKGALVKTKSTIAQVELNGQKRLSNLRGAFLSRKDKILKEKNILLIDDVLTTGATLNECAGSLKKAGAKSVYALVLASGVQ